MMPISEKYADMGCVVVGKVESGHVKKGQNLLLMPNKVRFRSQSQPRRYLVLTPSATGTGTRHGHWSTQ